MVLGALLPGGLELVMGLPYGKVEGLALDPVACFTAGVCGAVLAGWGATLALLARDLERLGPRTLGRAVVAGLVLWFVLDCATSIAHGAYFNCLGNLVYLGLLGIPGWLLWRDPDLAAGDDAGQRLGA